jgi:hypothetical protein
MSKAMMTIESDVIRHWFAPAILAICRRGADRRKRHVLDDHREPIASANGRTPCKKRQVPARNAWNCLEQDVLPSELPLEAAFPAISRCN